MIWLFKIDEVFWGNKPKVNEHYLFDVNDIGFDITLYDISLYFGLADYFLLCDSNDGDVYRLRLESINRNPIRILVEKNTEYHNVIQNYYIDKSKQK